MKYILLAAGTICITLGTIGIFLPILPTTPFLLLAASCYIRSSEKLYEKVVNNKIFGKYIRDYREGKGIPLKTKIYALLMLWISILYCVVFIVNIIYVKILLITIALLVSYHIYKK